jgi:hypothetical protein
VFEAVSIDVGEQVGMKGQQGKYAVQLSVNIVSVYCIFENNAIKIMINSKWYDNFEYISIMMVKY